MIADREILTKLFKKHVFRLDLDRNDDDRNQDDTLF